MVIKMIEDKDENINLSDNAESNFDLIDSK